MRLGLLNKSMSNLPDKYRQLKVQNKRIKTLEDWTPANEHELAEVRKIAQGLKDKLGQVQKAIKSFEKSEKE